MTATPALIKQACCGVVLNTAQKKNRVSREGSPCRKSGTIEHEGKWYCLLHDPVRAEDRPQLTAQRRLAAIAKRKADNILMRAAPAMRDALEYIVGNGLLQGQYEIHARASAKAYAALSQARGETNEPS